MELYIHIPFCKKKCDYCDFYSIMPCEKFNLDNYISTLLKEITLAGKKYGDRDITTIFIGGGTPSLLTNSQLDLIFDSLNKSFNLSKVEEITIESNPESITEDFLKHCKDFKINRISIGVQSLFDDNLKAVGRIHDKKTALESLKLANKYFDKISADLIIGLPYDTEEIVRNEIIELSQYVNHMSCYELMLNPDTKLYKNIEDKKLSVPNDDEVATLFDVAIDELQKQGFTRYEVSNFSKTHTCKHNMGYWDREEYLGFGPSAHSFVKDGKEFRFSNVDDIDQYINIVKNKNIYPFMDVEILSQKDIEEEKIFLSLRTTKGISKMYFTTKQLEKFKDFIIVKGDNVSLNNKGFAVMDSITIDLFP